MPNNAFPRFSIHVSAQRLGEPQGSSTATSSLPVAVPRLLGASYGSSTMEAITNYPKPLCVGAACRRSSGSFKRGLPTTPTSQDIKLPRGIAWTKGVSSH